MKKSTLLAAAFFLTLSTQAQSELFEQTAATGAGGFPSGYSDVSSLGVFSADDFNLAAQTDINSITVYGYQGDDDLQTYLTGFSLYIYSDAGGVPSGDPSIPGSAVLEIVNLSVSDPALTLTHPDNRYYNFTVDIAMAQGAPLTLPAGTYWIVAVPHSNIDATTIDLDGDTRLWLWFMSDQQNLSDSQYIDPSNLLNGGTSWSPVSGYTDNSSADNAFAFAFSVEADGFSITQPVTENIASSLYTGYFDPNQPGAFSADDFNLTEQSEISSVTVYGIQPDDDLQNYLTGFSLYIYSDVAGVPSGNPSVSGSGLLEIVNLSPSDQALTMSHPDTERYNFTVDIATAQGAPLTLPAGTYWIVAAPHSDVTNFDKLWYWSTSAQHNLSDSQYIDSNNVFGNGWTSWTSSSTVFFPWSKAFAFTITGANLSIELTALNEVSLYPNPVKNQLHIEMPKGVSIESVSVFDMLGKGYGMKIGADNTLDVSQMSSGIYVLKVETSTGSLTKKFVKE